MNTRKESREEQSGRRGKKATVCTVMYKRRGRREGDSEGMRKQRRVRRRKWEG